MNRRVIPIGAPKVRSRVIAVVQTEGPLYRQTCDSSTPAAARPSLGMTRPPLHGHQVLNAASRSLRKRRTDVSESTAGPPDSHAPEPSAQPSINAPAAAPRAAGAPG